MEIFKDIYGPGVSYREVPLSVIGAYEEVLPKFWLETWEAEGLLQFADSFFLTIIPEEFFNIISFFIKGDAQPIPIMRTAFGGLIFLDQQASESAESQNAKRYNYLCPIYRKITPLGDELDLVLDYWLTTEKFISDLMFFQDYSSARQDLSIVKEDECYAFVPALALGGEDSFKNIKVVKLKEQMAFLAELE